MRKNSQRFHWRCEAGRAVIWTPIWIAIAFLSFYALIKYAPIYIDYYRIKQAFDTVARDASHLNLDNIRYEVGTRIDSINPPFRKDDIRYSETPNGMVTIDIEYNVEVYHPVLDPQVLTFHPHVEFQRRSEN